MTYVSKAFIAIIFAMPVVSFSQKKESVLWKISGNGLSKTSYLFGTIHTASHIILDSFPQIIELIKTVDIGLFEKEASSIGEVKDTVIYTPPLDSIFTKSEYQIVDSFFTHSSYGSIVPHNNDASPEAMFQVVLMLKGKDSWGNKMFFDEYIQDTMEKLEKKCFQLDEPVEMARSASQVNYRKVAESIVFLIKNDFSSKDLLAANFFDEELYIKSLTNDLRLTKDVPEGTIKEGTVERNLIWLPKIISKIKEASCFITVGLGHLKYKSGLIMLLKSKGYKLEPIKLKKVI